MSIKEKFLLKMQKHLKKVQPAAPYEDAIKINKNGNLWVCGRRVCRIYTKNYTIEDRDGDVIIRIMNNQTKME